MSFSEIDWGATIKLVLMRLVAAGTVIGVIMFVGNPGLESLLSILLAPVAVGIMVLFAVSCAALGKLGIPWIGLGALGGLATIIGDPLLWALSKRKPDLLPVQAFGFVNWPVRLVNK